MTKAGTPTFYFCGLESWDTEVWDTHFGESSDTHFWKAGESWDTHFSLSKESWDTHFLFREGKAGTPTFFRECVDGAQEQRRAI